MPRVNVSKLCEKKFQHVLNVGYNLVRIPCGNNQQKTVDMEKKVRREALRLLFIWLYYLTIFASVAFLLSFLLLQLLYNLMDLLSSDQAPVPG